MQKSFYFFCCLMYVSSAQAQFTVSGKILSESQQPLSGSHVHIGAKTVYADVSGNYAVGNVSGTLKVLVSYVGYQSVDTIINVDTNLVIDFKLMQKAAPLAEVMVSQNPNGFNESVLEQKVKREQIEHFSNQTLGDVLKELPGISSLKTGSTVVKPVINGLFGSRVPVINNNVRMEDQEWGTEHAPNFDVNAAGKITVLKGASGLQYGGNAVGGIVVMEPVSVKKDTLYGKTILNGATNGRGGSISSSLHKGNFCDWSWNVLGTFKYMGDKQAPDYTLSNTGNREANFSGDIKYIGKDYHVLAYYSFYHTAIGILSASHSGSVNDLYNSINNQTPSVIRDFTYEINNPKQKVTHHLAKLAYTKYFSERSQLAVQYAFQFNKRLEFDLRRQEYNDIAALDLELATHTVNVDYKLDGENWKLKSGANGSYQNNFADPSTGVRPLIPTYQKTDAGIYGILAHNLSETMVVETGIRFDFSHIEAQKYYLKSRWEERGYDAEFSHFIVGESGNQWLAKPEFTFGNFSGSIGFKKDLGGNLDWYANVSLATRNPNPSEFFSDGLHHSTGIIELGDLALEKEQAYKFSTAFAKKWNSFSIEVNPYLNLIADYMYLTPTVFETTIRGAFPVWEYRQADARLFGIDFQSVWNFDANWKHQFAFSYVNGKDNDNLPLIDMPPLNLSNKISFSKKEWHELLVEVKSEIVFRQGDYPNNNFSTNIVVDGEFVPVVVDISTPPPAYHLLHLYSEMKFKTSGNIGTTVALSVQNIFNATYRDYLNRQRFFADEMGRNIQLQLKFNY